MIATRQLGETGLDVSTLGLGCARIASLSTRPSAREISALIHQAYDGGIRFFDTADIYGQGDSERRLADIARRDDVVICTKAGLRLKNSQTLIRLAKPVLRPIVNSLGRARSKAAALRRESEDIDFDPATLRQRLEGSLRRLGRDRVEVFLLHSPPLGLLADGQLYDVLDEIRAAGLAVACGVSCRSVEDAGVVTGSGRVGVVQIPLDAAGLAAARPVLDLAHEQGVGVIAREIFAGGTLPGPRLADDLRKILSEPRIHVSLIGTTDAAHLAENLAIARGDGAGDA